MKEQLDKLVDKFFKHLQVGRSVLAASALAPCESVRGMRGVRV